MPSEKIHSVHEIPVGEGEAPPILVVDIRWGHGDSVQVGVIDESQEMFTKERGYYFTPTREQINHMVRALRKARDQAFGADA